MKTCSDREIVSIEEWCWHPTEKVTYWKVRYVYEGRTFDIAVAAVDELDAMRRFPIALEEHSKTYDED